MHLQDKRCTFRPSPACRHRGSGASKVQGHNVQENTLLSFQKAALNHSEFIEFDVSCCGQLDQAAAVCGGPSTGSCCFDGVYTSSRCRAGHGWISHTCWLPPNC